MQYSSYSYTWAELWPGDIVLIGSNAWFGRLIRWGSRSKGESETVVNHAGIIGTAGTGYDLSGTLIEALWKVEENPLTTRRNDRVYVFRDATLTADQRHQLVNAGRSWLGTGYGPLQLVAQLVDTKLFGGKVVARKAEALDPLPICSKLVAELYGSLGRHFGVEDYAASPDDIWDFVTQSRKYVLVWRH